MTMDVFRRNISIVILNYNRTDTTVASVDAAAASVGECVKEILVVDNGSAPESVRALETGISGKARLVAVGTNRYFGEGNNIGAEEAGGEFLLFLNNDAFVEPDCIETLARRMASDPSIAAVGPMFLYPGGRVQEVGGVVLETGEVVQVGKGAVWAANHYTEPCAVDYVSAACVLMRTNDFFAVGGFDFQWEPAYYEDVDLCLKLWANAGRVVVEPRAQVVHMESLTTGDATMRLESQVEINRMKFVDKWAGWIKQKKGLDEYGPRPAAAASVSAPTDTAIARNEHPAGARDTASAATGPSSGGTGPSSLTLYAPYELIPGGGERVLFELASLFCDRIGRDNVSITSPHRYSALRIRQLADSFGHPSVPTPRTLVELEAHPPQVTLVMGNEVVPPIPGYGEHNIYLCQFPFSAADHYIDAHRAFLQTFDEIWVYSEFVRRYVSGLIRLLGLPAPPIRVMYPPSTFPTPDSLVPWRERNTILTVGRFFKGGHDKRQDIAIEIADHVALLLGRRVPLVVAGALHATGESRDRFHELTKLGEGKACRFYPNASRERLAELYSDAAVLVHAAGFGIDQYAFPERLEHFGITPVEAASLGCIPVPYGEGGPAEVMGLLGCATTFHTVQEAAEIIAGLFSDPEGSDTLSRELPGRAQQFSASCFRTRAWDTVSSLLR